MIRDEHLKILCIKASDTLLDALKAITVGVSRIALITNESGILEGILVDGDIRKALLKGAQLNSPVGEHMNRNYFSVEPHVDRITVLEYMKARFMSQVPIVDEKRKLCGVHLIHEILGRQKRENWAVIMAGGKGTRLGSMTHNFPKPMLQVGGRPILERLVVLLASYGIQRIYLAINYLGHIIEDFFQDGHRYGLEIKYLRESESMGSGGALSLLPETPKAPLIVMNGDLVIDFNLGDFLAFHTNGNYKATIGVWRYGHEVPYGCVEIVDDSVRAIHEKPVIEKDINAGIYILAPEMVKRIPNKFFPMTDLFIKAIKNNEKIGAYHIKEGWLDIGLPSHLEKARTGV